MKKKYIITGLTCVFVLISGICYSCAYKNQSSALLLSSGTEAEAVEGAQNVDTIVTDIPEPTGEATKVDAGQAESAEKVYIYVHVCGAVVNPGVYQVEVGSRVVDLIEASGGLCEDAAGDYINQAQAVEDGQRIYIPAEDEVDELSPLEYQSDALSNGQTSQDATLVNINTADAEELMNLPGIGQAKADSIITYRTENGNFKTIEDLMSIPGIKEGLFGKVSSLITVD